jgi:hypothetical protein
MQSQKEIKFLENEIRRHKKKYLDSINSIYKWGSNEEYASYHREEDEGMALYSMKSIYHHLTVYLELRGLNEFNRELKMTLGAKIKDNKAILSFTEWEGDVYPKMLDEIDYFIRPFQGIESPMKKEQEQDRLRDILESTSEILKKTKTKPSNEAAVYNDVRWALNLYFTSAKKVPPANFIGHFKSYRPDILIPELKTVIEYKYVNGKKDIDSYLDELVADAKAYVNDEKYDKYIAVLCLKKNSVTKSTIKYAWNQKDFPSSWELIIVNL